MKTLLAVDIRIRYAIGAGVMALSLFLLGAAPVGGAIRESRVHKLERSEAACRDAMRNLSAGISAVDRNAWNSLLQENPGLALRVSCPALKTK